MTYTVFSMADPTAVLGRALTAEEAMDELLTYDGYDYQIRREPAGGWRLYHSTASRNSPRGARELRPTVAFSLAEDEAAARAEIAEQVLTADWPALPGCMADASYDAMMKTPA